jgi:hypothetical protein
MAVSFAFLHTRPRFPIMIHTGLGGAPASPDLHRFSFEATESHIA